MMVLQLAWWENPYIDNEHTSLLRFLATKA